MIVHKFKVVKEESGAFIIHSKVTFEMVGGASRFTEVYNRGREGTIINNGLEEFLEAIEGIEFKIERSVGSANQHS